MENTNDACKSAGRGDDIGTAAPEGKASAREFRRTAGQDTDLRRAPRLKAAATAVSILAPLLLVFIRQAHALYHAHANALELFAVRI